MAKQPLIYILLLLTLSACGWQLRDTGHLSADIGSVHLSYKASQDNFIKELKRALERVGVPVVTLKSEADYSIVIDDISSSRRASTLNSGARVAEYQLNQKIDFFIMDQAGVQLIPLSTVAVEKVFEFDEQDVLASANEEQAIRDQINRESVRQILNQLSQLALTHLQAQ